MELSAPSHCVAGWVFSEALKVYPPLKLKVFVDDIAAFMERNKELVGIAAKVLNAIIRGVEVKVSKLSITEGRKEGKSEVITSCSYMEEKFQECSGKGGSGTGHKRRHVRSGPEDENEAVGGKIQSGEDKVRCEVLVGQDKSSVHP